MLLEVAKIIRPHGLRGEVVVDLITNRTERLLPGSKLALGLSGSVVASDDRHLVVLSSRPHQGRFLVRFEGIEGIDNAEKLRGIVLYAEPIADPDALFIHELIGKEVLDATGVSRGTVTAVEANPASDLLVLDGTWRVPADFIVSVETAITVEAPEGLFE